MYKTGTLNSEISKVLSDLGHTDTIVIADCGLPVPKGVQKIDLAVRQGLPSFIDVVGFDGNDDAMKSIKNKKLDATIAQQPALMGEDAVKAILDLKDGKKIKSEVKVPLKLVEQ